MTARGKDPRHEFVPAMPHKFAIGDNVRFHPGAGRAIDRTNRTSESPKGITGHALSDSGGGGGKFAYHSPIDWARSIS